MSKKERKSARERAAFVAGRDLAVAMLREAEAEVAPEDFVVASIESRSRYGRPQCHIPLAYLERVIAEPRLAPGFAAVLCDALFGGATPNPDVYAALDAAEMLDVPKKWRGLSFDEIYEMEELCLARRDDADARSARPACAFMPEPGDSARH